MAYQPYPGNSVLLAPTAETITSTVTSLSATALTSGQCVVVTLDNNLGSVWPTNVCIRVRDTTNGISTAWQNAGVLYTAGNAQLYFNLPVTNGDTVVIDVISISSIGSNGVKVAAVLSPLAIPTNLRADGRSKPLGSSAVGQTYSDTTQTMVAATAGWRQLVLQATILGGRQTNLAQTAVYGIVNGAAAFLVNVTSVGTTAMPGWQGLSYDNGVLMDDNAAITYYWNGSTVGLTDDGNASVLFDWVPAT
jgi:hypothetical protein